MNRLKNIKKRGALIALLLFVLAVLLAPSAPPADKTPKGTPEIITADRFEGRIKAL